jgi:hypothetical protein
VRKEQGLESLFESHDARFGAIHLVTPLLSIGSIRLVEHLAGGRQVILGGAQFQPRDVDVAQFLVTTRQVAQTREVIRDVGF